MQSARQLLHDQVTSGQSENYISAGSCCRIGCGGHLGALSCGSPSCHAFTRVTFLPCCVWVHKEGAGRRASHKLLIYNFLNPTLWQAQCYGPGRQVKTTWFCPQGAQSIIGGKRAGRQVGKPMWQVTLINPWNMDACVGGGGITLKKLGGALAVSYEGKSGVLLERE